MRFFRVIPAWLSLLLIVALGKASSQDWGGVPLAGGAVQDPIKGTGSQGAEASSLPALSHSYFLGSIHTSTGAETNPSLLSAYSSQISSVTNLLGNFSLRRFRRDSETAVDYRGGDTLYRGYSNLALFSQQFHRLSVDQGFRWARGELNVKDLFSYTGNRGFGSSSQGGIDNPSAPGGSEFFGATLFGPSSLGNVTMASISERLTKRSSATFSGAYSTTNFLGNSQGLFDSRQISTQTGYTFEISRRNTLGVEYGYQAFTFVPNVQSLVTNSAMFVFQRRLSSRIDLVLGAGPERIVSSGISSKSQIDSMAKAKISYRARKSNLNLSYDRLVTSGSGFYAGGISNTAVLSVDRKLSQSWQVVVSGSYDAVRELTVSNFGTRLPNSRYWLAGASVHHRLGRSLSVFASYQFNYDGFSLCSGDQTCSPAVHRNVLLTGFDWSIRPFRLE